MAARMRGTIHFMYQQLTHTEPACVEFQQGNVLSAFPDEASVITVSQDYTRGDSNAAVPQRTDLWPQANLTVLLSPVPITKSFSLTPEGAKVGSGVRGS